MGHRLSKIYTRTGDKGTTSLADGSLLDKDHQRIATFGDIDELNSLLGLLLAHDIDEGISDHLQQIQHILFDLGGEFAIPGSELLDNTHVCYLEEIIDQYNAGLPPLKEFILPGGCIPVAICHFSRSVCRRAERQCVTLSKESAINQASLRFLNRLSDLLFVFARSLTRIKGDREIYWRSERIKDQ